MRFHCPPVEIIHEKTALLRNLLTSGGNYSQKNCPFEESVNLRWELFTNKCVFEESVNLQWKLFTKIAMGIILEVTMGVSNRNPYSTSPPDRANRANRWNRNRPNRVNRVNRNRWNRSNRENRNRQNRRGL